MTVKVDGPRPLVTVKPVDEKPRAEDVVPPPPVQGPPPPWQAVGPQKAGAPAAVGAVDGPKKVAPTETFSKSALSVQQLRAVMPNLSPDKAAAMLPHLNRAMEEFGINTPARASAFLAQVAHESGEFKYMEELASGRAYEGRRDLGNTQPGDGERFKGRGPIQLTGRANYTKAAAALGLDGHDAEHPDIVTHPELAARPDIGCKLAGWFWQTRGLNKLADEGNFNEITRRVNGGFNGAASRNNYYNKAREALGAGMGGGPLATGDTPIPNMGSGPRSYGVQRGQSYGSTGAEAQRMVGGYAQQGGIDANRLFMLLLLALERINDGDLAVNPDFAAFAKAAGSDWQPGQPIPEDLKTEFLTSVIAQQAKSNPRGLDGVMDDLKNGKSLLAPPPAQVEQR
jgi:predicted chitinase